MENTEMRKKIDKLLLRVKTPSRYIGGELNSVVKNRDKVDVRFAFCFPDSYDVGMSHIGMKILYSLKNRRENWWCERVFAPWPDFEELMRENDIPLYGLESLDPIKDFDFIGFTVQYELCYSNILNMLDLAGLPVRAEDRGDEYPVVVAGGPCVCNPEPLCDFIDLFIIGEGEEVNMELLELYEGMKKSGKYTKQSFLEEAAKIEGIYVPSFYDVSYDEKGIVESIRPNRSGVPEKVTKRIINDMDKVFYPDEFVVPFSDIVHDRAVVEVLRGCIRGCRFCQAGFIYRPFREKSTDTVCRQAKCLCESTGYEEVSLSSLSTSDFSDVENMLLKMTEYTEGEKVNLSLPSMRIDRFSKELMEQLQKVRKSGLTFAPEAGTQRLRDVINKNITEDEIMRACRTAFSGGYSAVKLYFMLGLPEETDEDIIGIGKLAERIADEFYRNPSRPKGQRLQISISCATFVPKPFTPFEFEPQITVEEIKRRQKLLLDSTKGKKYINVSYHNYRISILEAALAKGDRRLGRVIERAWRTGCKFDGWDELYKFDTWMEAFKEEGVDIGFYSHRKAEYDEHTPWEHLDYMISKSFLIRENKKAHEAVTTPNCREKCSACGVSGCTGEVCEVARKGGASA
ncbi:MAG: TIGR03960 family B12-binding radical SAM protein [Huintestinicola sp.]